MAEPKGAPKSKANRSTLKPYQFSFSFRMEKEGSRPKTQCTAATDTNREIVGTADTFDFEQSLSDHIELLDMHEDADSTSGLLEEVRNCPLFGTEAAKEAERLHETKNTTKVFPAFGLIAGRCRSNRDTDIDSIDKECENTAEDFWKQHRNTTDCMQRPSDVRIFLNVNAPWSAFICGSQGSGKSHSLSCMLENCLVRDRRLGLLPSPLAGLVFHYDTFNSASGGSPCEAAYLASAGIPVKVLVSKSNETRMKHLYRSLDKRIEVGPLVIDERYLTAESMLSLMVANTADGNSQPLYMQALLQVLREMALETDWTGGVDYLAFKENLSRKNLTREQRGPLDLRLDRLEHFILDKVERTKSFKYARSADWTPKSGQLTIIDLSCPFVDADTACGLFDICLTIFQAQKMSVGRIVALDEAHKFMNTTDSANRLTENLKSVIRLQRHLASRVIIATQEPTISTTLLDLCSITLVHRFNSPQWFKALKGHLAAVAEDDSKPKKGDSTVTEQHEDVNEDESGLFGKIVRLGVGEALLCAPSAMLEVSMQKGAGNGRAKIQRLGTKHLKVKIRNRISADGGRSVVVS